MRAKLFNEEKLIRYRPGGLSGSPGRFLNKIYTSPSYRTPPSPHFLRSSVVELELPDLAGAGKTTGSSSALRRYVTNMFYRCKLKNWRCGGSLVAHQTSEAEVPGWNPTPSTLILMRCRIIVK